MLIFAEHVNKINKDVIVNIEGDYQTKNTKNMILLMTTFSTNERYPLTLMNKTG